MSKRILSPWSKAVKKRMIDNDLSTVELAEQLNMSRSHLSSVINGITYSKPAIEKISIALGVPVSPNTLATK